MNLKKYQAWVPVLMLAALFAAAYLGIPGFQQPRIYLTILKNGAWNGILALGLLMVLICGDIDLSIGAQMSFYGVLCALAMKRGIPISLSILLTLIAALGTGCFLGTAVGRFRVNSVIATIAMTITLEGVSQIITRGIPVYNLPDAFVEGAVHKFLGLSQPTLVWFLLTGLTALFLRQTYWGRFFYAVGSNRDAARRAGVPIAGTKTVAFALNSLLCAVSGIVYIAQIGLAPLNAGRGAHISVLTIAALGGVSFSGGKGKVLPVFCGALFLSALTSIFIVLRVPPYYQNCIKGSILFVAALTKMRKS
ncbi:ABC transporter permease [Oscillospiraceae bacterium 38-13]